VPDNLKNALPQKDRERRKFEDLLPQKHRKYIDIFKEVTILVVVDDAKDICVLITYIFESYGIRVMTASNALAGFEVIKQFPVDILIIDINMPGESGYWLIQIVRSLSLPQKREIPAIAFSSSNDSKGHKQAFASGFQTYIKKPSNATSLITEVAKLLRRSGKSSSSLFGDYSWLGLK